MHSEFRRFEQQREASITTKGITKEEVQQDTEVFLAKGGIVTKLPSGMRRDDPFAGSNHFNNAIVGEKK